MPLIDTATNLISSLGFPIACAMAVAYVFYSFLKTYQNENAKREERFLTTIGDFSTTIEKLTTTLAAIDSRLTCIETSLKLDNEKENEL